jgi:hypothetical protein
MTSEKSYELARRLDDHIVTHAFVTSTPAGLFFYDGPPATGNLILAISPAAGTDGYGNTYTKGLTCADPAVLYFPSRQGFEGGAALIESAFSAPGVAQYLQMVLQGPSTNVTGARDAVAILMNSAAKDNSSNANMDFIYTGSNGVAHQQAYLDATGFIIQAGQIIATEAGVTPAVPASWKTITLQNGYVAGTNNGFSDVPQIRMMADNKTLAFKGSLTVPASSPSNVWGLLPSGFPNASLGGPFGYGIIASYSGGTTDHIAVQNNSNLRIENPTAHTATTFNLSCVVQTQ